MAEIEKTPTLGLNKPPKGYFDWDVPLNENWDKLDFLGAGQLPLLAQIQLDHRLEGEEATGWAMQGSVLDGDRYTSVWEKLKTAKDRATQVTAKFNDVTYTYFKDATSGWVFLDQANYDKAFTNLKDSLGFILTDVDGVKTITLPKKEVYLKPSLSDANVFDAESLPDHRHDIGFDDYLGTQYGNKTISGSFLLAGYGQAGRASTSALTSMASASDSRYKSGAKVNPDHSTVFIYYKVGNTIVNQDQIDVGNLNSQVDDLATNKADKDLSNVSAAGKQTAISWGMPNYSAGVSGSQTFTATYDCLYFGVFNRTRDNTITMTLNNKTITLWKAFATYNYYDGIIQIYLSAGDKISFNYALDSVTIYPLKGN